SYKTLKKLGYKVDFLQKDELKKKFPQFSAKLGVLDHHGGVLEASSAVESFVSLAKQKGVELMENTRVLEIKNHSLILENKLTVEFKKLIVTCGVWASKLVNLPIRSTKQQVVYFEPKNKI